MRTIYLALDYKCNHNCMICPLSTFDKLHKPLSMEDVKNTIEANDLGEGDRVVLSGGEPCLSALFLDAVKYIMDKGLGITMLSNVSCFANIDFVKQLEDVVDRSRFDIINGSVSLFANKRSDHNDNVKRYKNHTQITHESGVDRFESQCFAERRNRILFTDESILAVKTHTYKNKDRGIKDR